MIDPVLAIVMPSGLPDFIMRVGLSSIYDARICTLLLHAARELGLDMAPLGNLSFADILTQRMMILAQTCGPPGCVVTLDIGGTTVRSVS
jgi:hypothetical protein